CESGQQAHGNQHGNCAGAQERQSFGKCEHRIHSGNGSSETPDRTRLFMPEPLVYLNGRLLSASQAHLKIYDAGLVWGATVTEQLRTFHQRLYKLDAHLDRLFQSLRFLRLDVPHTRQELATVAQELVAHHAKLLGGGVELGLIQFVTAGEHAAYASSAAARAGPTVCMHTFPLPFERWAAALQTGLHLVT